MRRVVLVLLTLALASCATQPVEQPDIRAASAAAVARAEFTFVGASQREPFPTQDVVALDGYAWSSANIGAHVAVVNFWASWCQPCRDEWPELSAASAGHPSVRFLGVNTLDEPAAARAFIRAHPTEYRHIVDADGGLLRSLRTVSAPMLPATVIVDREGNIAAWKVGPVLRGQIRRVLAKLLRDG